MQTMLWVCSIVVVADPPHPRRGRAVEEPARVQLEHLQFNTLAEHSGSDLHARVILFHLRRDKSIDRKRKKKKIHLVSIDGGGGK